MTRETSTQVYHIFFKILAHQNLTDKNAANILDLQTKMISIYRTKDKPIPANNLFKLIDKFGYSLIIIHKPKRKK
jgi:predicted transcriptional regulator